MRMCPAALGADDKARTVVSKVVAEQGAAVAPVTKIYRPVTRFVYGGSSLARCCGQLQTWPKPHMKASGPAKRIIRGRSAVAPTSWRVLPLSYPSSRLPPHASGRFFFLNN